MIHSTHYADVLLPLAIPGTYTYALPTELADFARPRCRVVVQFGPKRFYTGIIVEIHDRKPDYKNIKPIFDLLESEPVLNEYQLRFLQWMARYYMCYEGEVLQAMLPTGLKITSHSLVVLNPEWNGQLSYELDNEEAQLIDYLTKHQAADMHKARQLLGQKKMVSRIKRLYQAGIITLQEELKKSVQPVYEKWVRLTAKFCQVEILNDYLPQLEKNPKQLELLLYYLSHVPIWNQPHLNEKGINKNQLIDDGRSESALNTMVKKGVLEVYQVKKSRFESYVPDDKVQYRLSESQQIALDRIHQHFKNKKIVLLQGVTGSGKTEIYIQLIKEVLVAGGQVLYLLPEIALTTQMVARLQVIFGQALGVYHSQTSDREKIEIWEQLSTGKLQVIVGVRSSIFLPFNQLALVIIDEEHDPSYKQSEPAPRYHIRESAISLAKLHGAMVLLGSATPSIESYFETKQNRWGLVTLHERYAGSPLPTIETIDTRQETLLKRMKNEFSQTLLDRISQQTAAGNQAIIFQNRRGYAPYIRCDDCGWVPECEYCDISFTLHQKVGKLICHICGNKKQVPGTCPDCGSVKIKTVGFGTEKLEESLSILLPELTVARMDLDTTRSRSSLKRIIEDVENRKVDVLVGTQMVSKGFDFERMQLVGILDVDKLLHLPNFRAVERAFQLVLQVAGRAGRRHEAGEVLIQTAAPHQPFIKWVKNYDYDAFYEHEVEERRKFHYPPYTRLIRLVFRHKQEEAARQGAEKFYQMIVNQLGQEQIMGPGVPAVAKVKGYYIFDIWLKLDRVSVNITKVKSYIFQALNSFKALPIYKKVDVYADVDPV